MSEVAMSKIIYETKITCVGSEVQSFGDDLMILFGEKAPATLKNYCYNIDVNPTAANIESGQTLTIDDNQYKILYVGDAAERNLTAQGHVTINFTGMKEAMLPGSIVVEKSAKPDAEIGSVIRIKMD